METILQTAAASLASALVVGVVTAAFIRPKLFMRIYPHLLIGCLVCMTFGTGAAFGGKVGTGIWLTCGAVLAAIALIVVLRPAAQQEAEHESSAEEARRDDP